MDSFNYNVTFWRVFTFLCICSHPIVPTHTFFVLLRACIGHRQHTHHITLIYGALHPRSHITVKSRGWFARGMGLNSCASAPGGCGLTELMWRHVGAAARWLMPIWFSSRKDGLAPITRWRRSSASRFPVCCCSRALFTLPRVTHQTLRQVLMKCRSHCWNSCTRAKSDQHVPPAAAWVSLIPLDVITSGQITTLLRSD